ncbi:MAG: beta-galactosidase, partial [Candidatus Eremiobacteraeota bacterium]|nr:beta-galactosidase [Candidatus Eremiobacteraeota bacterium]
AALTAGIVLVQGAGQVIALALARRAQPDAPFRVPLYPLPPLIALAGWLFLFWSTGAVAIAFGLITLAVGASVFLVRARIVRSWPFASATVAALLLMFSFMTSAAVAEPLPRSPVPRADTAYLGPRAAASADRFSANTRPANGAPSFGHAMVVRDAHGEPVFTVDGKPFFFLGGAFFYERIPRSRWRHAMLQMKSIGANTLDLYVPWNWHELADGDFDFDGRTNPRRDLREVVRLGKELGFFFIVRPGPVIRNEWRNGGYPAWLLQRPEYGMPLHDVLEGRYPATATLQNAHADDAAAEWMRNTTHVRHASRWLHRALEQFRPVADRVLAVQLDDDQGAYLDNDTYPAPHLHDYLRWIERQAREVVGPVTPAFINTFEMKVPSSSPVWAMGNWYQSDASVLGEHDRAELAFATATLRTQSTGPLAISEFQAGWLAGPGDPLPRLSDATNTKLAIGELAGWGMKGLIDFPLQDTLAPFGWEAPFSNAFYNWSAAFALDGTLNARGQTTAQMFGQLAFYGPALAQAHRAADVAVPYDGRADAFHAAAQVKESLAACRRLGIACDVVDPVSVSDAQLATFRYAVLRDGDPAAFAARVARAGARAVASVDAATGVRRTPGVTLLRSPHGTFLVVENWTDRSVRYDASFLPEEAARVTPFVIGPRDARIVALDADLHVLSPRYAPGDRLTSTCRVASALAGSPVFLQGDALYDIAPRGDDNGFACTASARLGGRESRWTLDGRHSVALRSGALPQPAVYPLSPSQRPITPGIQLGLGARYPEPHVQLGLRPGPHAYRSDVFEDGAHDIVLQNDRVIAIVVPDGGARVVSFGPYTTPLQADTNFGTVFDATGALRDDVLVQPRPSPTDRIAKYTHLYPAGMFNRPYAGCTFEAPAGAGAYLSYDAPDVLPSGARFERVVMVGAKTDRLVVDERFTPRGAAEQQRLVSYSALAANDLLAPLPFAPAGTELSPFERGVQIDPRLGGFTVDAGASGTPGAAVLSVAWRPGDVESASWARSRGNGTLRLVFAPGGWRRVTFASAPRTAAGATAFLEAERAWVAANGPPIGGEDGEVAKRYTQSPQKRPSESSCGFESHLPYD